MSENIIVFQQWSNMSLELLYFLSRLNLNNKKQKQVRLFFEKQHVKCDFSKKSGDFAYFNDSVTEFRYAVRQVFLASSMRN